MRIQPGRTTAQAQGVQVRAEALKRFEEIRRSTDLSESGKTRALARAWSDAEADLAQIRGQIRAEQDRRRDSLRARLFGTQAATGVDAIGFRDAHTRAGQLSSQDDAIGLLAVSRLSGDTVLAKAVALRAFAENWTRVLSVFADGDPAVEADINELFMLDASNGSPGSVASRLENDMATTLMKPAEIQHMSVSELVQVGASA